MSVRKQVGELSTRDLAEFPVWEFALDEEGEPGQDEETVKPRPDLAGDIKPDDGLFVVKAEFTTPDGRHLDGFVTPDADGDLSAVQPTVITERGQVQFWFGIHQPSQGEISRRYETLGGARADVFPLSYRASVRVAGEPMEGQVPGFMYLDDEGAVRRAEPS